MPASVPPATAAPAGPADCPSSSLTVSALRGSGAAGHQYAFLQFTNKSASSCSLTGFPGVQLIRGGALMAKPAVRSGKAVTTLRLAPGKSATAELTDDSTCDAEMSDSVQVIVPNRSEKLVLHLALRGCPLSIDPVAVTAG
jgi:hypothetical protein